MKELVPLKPSPKPVEIKSLYQIRSSVLLAINLHFLDDAKQNIHLIGSEHRAFLKVYRVLLFTLRGCHHSFRFYFSHENE